MASATEDLSCYVQITQLATTDTVDGSSHTHPVQRLLWPDQAGFLFKKASKWSTNLALAHAIRMLATASVIARAINFKEV